MIVKTMKRLVIFVLSLVLLSSCVSTDNKDYTLKVKINENDCLKCMSAQSLLKDFSEVANIHLFFDGLNDKEIERFLKINSMDYLEQIPTCKIISDKNEYDNYVKTSNISECRLFDKNNEMITEFSFRMDAATLGFINDFLDMARQQSSDEEPIRLQTDYNSTSSKFYVSEKYYVLLNGSMNVCQVFDKNGKLIREIDGAAIDPLDIFKEIDMTNDAVKQSVEYMKSNGMFSCDPVNVKIYGDNILVGYRVPCLENRSGSFHLLSYYQLLSFVIGKEGYDVIFDGSKEDVVGLVFDEKKNNVLLEEYIDNVTSQRYYVSCDYKFDNGELMMTSENIVDYPDFERIQSFYYGPKLKDGFLNLRQTDYLVKNDNVINLPFKCNFRLIELGNFRFDADYDFNLVDWSCIGEKIGIVYFNNEDDAYYHAIMTDKGEVVSDKKIDVDILDVKTFVMQSPHKAILLTTDNQVKEFWFR